MLPGTAARISKADLRAGLTVDLEAVHLEGDNYAVPLYSAAVPSRVSHLAHCLSVGRRLEAMNPGRMVRGPEWR